MSLKTKRSNGHGTVRFQIQPNTVLATSGSRVHCLKCQGWIVIREVDCNKKLEMRCLNCGWQPQYGKRLIQETEEARSIRRFTASVFSGTSNNLPITPLEESFQQIDFSKSAKRR